MKIRLLEEILFSVAFLGFFGGFIFVQKLHAAGLPTVTTSAGTPANTSAILNSTVNPNGANTNVYYLWDTVNNSCALLANTLNGPTGLTGIADLSGASTQAILSPLSGNKTYYYCVMATNQYGTNYGSVAQVTTTPTPGAYTLMDAGSVVGGSGTDCDDTNAGPCTPTAGAFTSVGQTAQTLNWTPNTTNGPAATSYDVYKCGSSSSCATYTGPFNVAAPTVTYVDNSPVLSCGTTYYYKIVSKNAAGSSIGTSPFSNSTSICVTAPSITAQNATSVTTNSVTFTSTVNGNNGATNITYRYSTSNLSCSSLGTTLAGTNTNFTGLVSDSKSTGAVLSPNQTYYYCATADNTAAGGGATNGVSNNNIASSFKTYPGAPTITSVGSATQTSLTVNWTAPSGGEDSYKLYYCDRTANGACTPNIQIGGTISNASTSYLQNTVITCGRTYAYQLFATNATGDSAGSNISTGSTSLCVTAPSITAQGATANDSTSATFTSTVNGNNGATNITYRYSTSNFACNSLGSTLSGTNTNFTGSVSDSKGSGAVLSPNITYYYCATADNTPAGGGLTNGVSNNNLANNFTTFPGSPTGVSATALSSSQINISWTAPAGGANSYNLIWCQGVSCTPTNTITGVSSVYTHSPLSASTTYGYQVVAVNGRGVSAASSPVAYATTQASCTNGYKDYDGDGYGAGSYSCWNPGAGYTVVGTGGDCYDYDGANGTIRSQSALAHPGQTSLYSIPRGTASGVNDWAGNSYSSYDYDCDGNYTNSLNGQTTAPGSMPSVYYCVGGPYVAYNYYSYCSVPCTPYCCGYSNTCDTHRYCSSYSYSAISCGSTYTLFSSGPSYTGYNNSASCGGNNAYTYGYYEANSGASSVSCR